MLSLKRRLASKVRRDNCECSQRHIYGGQTSTNFCTKNYCYSLSIMERAATAP